MSNSIWKTPDVKPDGEDTYIAITEDGLICDFVSPKMCDNSVDRWAYLTDIIAQADKAERLQKALDVAVDAIKNATEYLGNQEPLVDVMAMNLYTDLSKALDKITAPEQKENQ